MPRLYHYIDCYNLWTTAEAGGYSAGLFRRNADVCAARPGASGLHVYALRMPRLPQAPGESAPISERESWGWNQTSSARLRAAHRARSMLAVCARTRVLTGQFEAFRAELSSEAVGSTLALGEPSAAAPAPPSAMDHEEDRSLSLGTEVSASVPPPSPLTGCYLLAVIGEPHTGEHKEIILQRLVKGTYRHALLDSW